MTTTLGSPPFTTLPEKKAKGKKGIYSIPNLSSFRITYGSSSPRPNSPSWTKTKFGRKSSNQNAVEIVRSLSQVKMPRLPSPDDEGHLQSRSQSRRAVVSPGGGSPDRIISLDLQPFDERNSTDTIDKESLETQPRQDDGRDALNSLGGVSPVRTPVPPEQKRNEMRLHLGMPEDGLVSGLVSPLASPCQVPQRSPSSPSSSTKTRGMSIVSPLGVSMPQPRRTYTNISDISMKIKDEDLKEEEEKADVDEGTREENQVEKDYEVVAIMEDGSLDPHSAGHMSSLPSLSSEETLNDRASSCYSVKSSSSSIYSAWPEEVQIRGHSSQKKNKAYSIIDPVSAGVFTDGQSMMRFPTLKKKFTIKESKNKPLPPEPPMEISPLLIRRLQNMQPSQHIQVTGRSRTPQSKPDLARRSPELAKHSTLPNNPRPRDFSTLDAAFLRAGIDPPSPDESKHVSLTLEEVAEDLEIQLSAIPRPLAVDKEQPRDGNQDYPSDLMGEPLQISRGRMEMVPTRSPPEVPNSAPFSMPSRNKTSENVRSPESAKEEKGGKHSRQFSLTKMTKRLSRGSLRGTVNKDSPRGAGPDQGLIDTTQTKKSSQHSTSSSWSSTSSGTKERKLRMQLPRLNTGQLSDRATDQLASKPKARAILGLDMAEAATEKQVVYNAPDHSGKEAAADEERMAEGDDTHAKIEQILANLNHSPPQVPQMSTQQLRDALAGEFPERVFQELLRQRSAADGSGLSTSWLDLPANGGIPIQSTNMLDGSAPFRNDVYELDAGSPSPVTCQTMEIEADDRSISTDAAEKVILGIMQHLDTLEDLFTTAVLSRGFYSVFKAHELSLIKSTLFKMSPAAWELREMSPPWNDEHQAALEVDVPVPEYTPSSFLNHYSRDLYTMVALKSLILVRCENLIREETVSALSGQDEERASELDDAFWRIWTFCRIFGCGKEREDDLVGQIDWLKGGPIAGGSSTTSQSVAFQNSFGMNSALFDPPEGFSKGNLTGLSSGQLHDMTEIWTCLSSLFQPLRGKCQDARQHGVFDESGIEPGDKEREEKLLEEWTYYVLTLGPSAILTLATISPDSAPDAAFARAKSLGWTTWSIPSAGVSRATFMKEAIARVCDTRSSMSHSGSRGTTRSAPTRNSSSNQSSQSSQSRSQGRVEYYSACESRTPTLPGYALRPPHPTFLQERPMSSFSTTMRHLDGSEEPGPPTVGQPPPYAQVLDPVDIAMHRMVEELGFSIEDAKWALKVTDTGDSIDAQAAIELLQRERKPRNATGVPNQMLSPMQGGLEIDQNMRKKPVWRWA